MTTIRDVVNQVEMVLNDARYPPTRRELEVLRKVLKTIYAHHRFSGDIPPPYPATASQTSAGVRSTLPGYTRLIGNHQQSPHTAVIIRS
jgi:hypothetical protein